MPTPREFPASDKELDVLRVLWEHGPATLRDVHGHLAKRYEYTTVQTMLDRLVQKGLVSRDRTQRPARHKAKLSRARALRHYLHVVTEKVSGGPGPLVLELLRERSFTSDELAEIRRLIEQAEAQGGTTDDRS